MMMTSRGTVRHDARPMRWDPLQYARYAGERGRPFFELTARIDAAAPATVVDLGCGPGDLTVSLAGRWPGARIRGLDSSPEMIARAPRDGGVEFAVADARDFDATGLDVLISNALLQWVPGHDELLLRWAAELNPGGWLAFQVPANFGAPSHVLMRELAASPRWRAQLDGVLRGTESTASPLEYLELLAGAGCEVDTWQTEYVHVLQGEDPVLEWVRGTGLRPVLAALSAADAERFTAEYAERLRDAYPRRPHGTAFPFARTFVVARRGD
jgi:trans-aconitate 2-methyltransferase